MTNPSPRNAKERAAHREEHSANTYYRRQLLSNDAEEVGRHAKSSTVVGAGPSPYPPTIPGSPWNDATAREAMNGPSPLGHDINALVPVGPPRRELAQSADPDLASLSDSELLHRRRWAELAMKQTFEDTAK